MHVHICAGANGGSLKKSCLLYYIAIRNGNLAELQLCAMHVCMWLQVCVLCMCAYVDAK